MIFGSDRDYSLLLGIQRELLRDIVEQEVLYYKINIEETSVNLYGEGLEKIYWVPVKLNCFITRGDQAIDIQTFLPDLNRTASFAFIRQDLVDVNVVPEVGDILEWNRQFFEVDTVRENQLFLGKDNQYNLTSYGHRFGASVSIIVDCHLTRGDRVGIEEVR